MNVAESWGRDVTEACIRDARAAFLGGLSRRTRNYTTDEHMLAAEAGAACGLVAMFDRLVVAARALGKLEDLTAMVAEVARTAQAEALS